MGVKSNEQPEQRGNARTAIPDVSRGASHWEIERKPGVLLARTARRAEQEHEQTQKQKQNRNKKLRLSITAEHKSNSVCLRDNEV